MDDRDKLIQDLRRKIDKLEKNNAVLLEVAIYQEKSLCEYCTQRLCEGCERGEHFEAK